MSGLMDCRNLPSPARPEGPLEAGPEHNDLGDRWNTRQAQTGDDCATGINKHATDHMPLYMQVATQLDDAIRSMKFAAGALLPTEKMLCRQYGVSRHTIRTAIRCLRDRGMLSTRPGVGTRVKGTGEPLANTTPSMSACSESDRPGKLSYPADASKKQDGQAERDWVHLQSFNLSNEQIPQSMLVEIYIEKAEGGRSPVVHLLLKTR